MSLKTKQKILLRRTDKKHFAPLPLVEIEQDASSAGSRSSPEDTESEANRHRQNSDWEEDRRSP